LLIYANNFRTFAVQYEIHLYEKSVKLTPLA
jgi:hypothetical protein